VVKQASGVVIAAPPVTGDRKVARRVRAYCTVIDAIRSGALPPGTRLPSARQLAAEWGYARGAIEEAFAQLQIEGFIERRVGDGSYVAAQAAAVQSVRAPARQRPLSRSAQQVLDRFSVYLGKPRQLELPHVMLAEQPLFPRAPMLREFPLEVWRRLISRAHGEAWRDHLTYGPAAGLPRLREAIARHLALARATPVLPQQVLVVNSPMQALELIARVLLEPGDKVWLEDPGHTSLISLFEVLRCQVFGVPLDGHGLDVDAGRAIAPDAALAYFHPVTQYPLGVRTSTERLRELLRWADESGAWIVEGNFNDEIVYDRALPAALWSMDESDRVLMMGTLEGIMYPSLRVAYLVVPQRLIEVFVAMRGLLGDSTNMQLQLALAWFIDEGHLATHLRQLRQVGRERRDALRAGAARHLPDGCTLGPLDGGLHGCIHLPPQVSDRDVVRRMRARNVLAVALSSGCIAPRPVPHGNGLAIGYGAFDAFTIDRALAVIGQCVRESMTAPCAPREHVPEGKAGRDPAERPGAGGAAPATPHQRAGENK
jgi:GntR family transcriptional regulator / MocR family aminotransferase